MTVPDSLLFRCCVSTEQVILNVDEGAIRGLQDGPSPGFDDDHTMQDLHS